MSSRPRLLADENIPRSVVEKLKARGLDVVSVWEYRPRLEDIEVLELAIREKRIVLTFDKDFGRLALAYSRVPGIILLRFRPRDPEYIYSRIVKALNAVKEPYNKLIIVRSRTIKVIKLSS